MRIVSSDGTRSFPYDDCGLIIRIMDIADILNYSINCIYYGKEYQLASYSEEHIATKIMRELMTTKSFIDGVNEDGSPYYDEILFIKLPTEEEFKRNC